MTTRRPAPATSDQPDRTIRAYRARRDFAVTAEPAPAAEAVAASAAPSGPAPIFVVQKHAAQRAGLHWDFRLEHGGVLWSWAVPKGPSLDPADRRMAIHVEDHPIPYADFQGTIPDGQYGAGTVETWDRGTWSPLGDPEQGMASGDLKFTLAGQRLSGRFTLARLKRRGAAKAEAWFLIKGHDEAARPGADAAALEVDAPQPAGRKPSRRSPAAGAVRGALPAQQAPQLCSFVAAPPETAGWLSEIKFDGYRILASVDRGTVRLLTRNGHDWTDRLPALARAIAQLPVQAAMLDGELVSIRSDGVSSFADLQAALSAGRDDRLLFYAFDLLHLDGWDLRSCPLSERKRVLASVCNGAGLLRLSGHVADRVAEMRRHACGLHLEGIICKRADAPYRAGRSGDWLKLKCQGREEFVVLGLTPPAGSRMGLGSLHVGYHDPDGHLHYAGGVGSGYSDAELAALRRRLDALRAEPPAGLVVAGDPLDPAIVWVRPELVVEVQFTAWSGAGRVRHGVFLGLREDKGAAEVVRDVADPTAERREFAPGPGTIRRAPHKVAVPPRARPPAQTQPRAQAAAIVVARAPKRAGVVIEGVEVTHADRALWPAEDGHPAITKQLLAEYWQAVAPAALGGIAHRPLSVVRCPDGIGGEQFFQKHGHGFMPAQVREGSAGKAPYLAIDDLAGLIAMAQMSAIELHGWGAAEADALHPDRLVFDLDPGEGVAYADVVRAAQDVRARLDRLGLQSFPRTTGGKGLHVVAPLVPKADWEQARGFCRAFAETMAQDQPALFLSTLKKADRAGKILVDWLRNGLGSTAVTSFSPRARPGAGVATPLAWDEVNARLDPAAFTLRSIPDRLARLRADPWADFAAAARPLPDLAASQAAKPTGTKPTGTKPGHSAIVHATKPKPRRSGSGTGP